MAGLRAPGPVAFDAEIRANPRGAGAWVDVPVAAVFDGRVEYRGSLTTMGAAGTVLGLRSDVREALGKGPGDRVHADVRLGTAPRVITPADDVRDALAAAGLADAFAALSYTHRREYHEWIEQANRASRHPRAPHRPDRRVPARRAALAALSGLDPGAGTG